MCKKYIHLHAGINNRFETILHQVQLKKDGGPLQCRTLKLRVGINGDQILRKRKD